MNELIKTQTNDNGEILVSGRDLHDYFESNERYSKWFSRMLGYGFTEDVDFTSVQKSTVVNNGASRNLMDHHIKLDAAKEIAMLQRSDRGKEARQYFINLEKLWNSPDMVIKRAMDFQQQKIETLEHRIQLDQPYTQYGRAVSSSDGAINIGEFAKIIYEKHGIKMGRNKMFYWLREKGYLIAQGRERNNPKQKYIEQGLFESVPKVISRVEKDIHTSTTLITGKGQLKIIELLLQEKQVS